MKYLLTLLLLASPVYGQAPPPSAGGFVFPSVPGPPTPTPTPAPKPAPGATVSLPADALYIITSKTDGVVIASTTDMCKKASDIVKITALKGPVTFALTKFVDGKGQRETRTISDPFIWTVEAVGPGTVELLAMPKTLTGESSVTRQMVTTNISPMPPPVPPTPPPPADPLTASLQAAYDKEAAADKALLPKLAALYKLSATLASDPSLATVGDLFTQMKTAGQSLVGASLPNVRAAIAAELKTVLPTAASSVLDVATRAAIAAEFAKVANALGGVK